MFINVLKEMLLRVNKLQLLGMNITLCLYLMQLYLLTVQIAIGEITENSTSSLIGEVQENLPRNQEYARRKG